MKTILIDGRWQAAQDERTIDVIDPSNAKVFSSISRGGEADVKLAVDAARRALSGPWGKMTATERGRLLQKLGELILANAEEIAQLEARDTGKPITVARNDVKVVARYFEFYGTAADKIHG
ncbi:aldehyde dehydrogenase family protein, partial [Herbaspirillum lusitanum]